MKIFDKVKQKMPHAIPFSAYRMVFELVIFTFRRSQGLPLGGVFTVSHEFHTNFAHYIDIADGYTGAVEIHCNNVSR